MSRKDQLLRDPDDEQQAHIPHRPARSQEDMVKIVQAARALKVNPHDFVVQTAVERAKHVLAK